MYMYYRISDTHNTNKAMNLTKVLFFYDTKHHRIDLAWTMTHLLTAIASCAVAIFSPLTSDNFLTSLVLALLFTIICRITLRSLGASRLSSLIVGIAALSFFSGYMPEQLLSVTIYIFTLLVIIEFMKLSQKNMALVAGLLIGLLAVFAGSAGPALIVLALLLLFCRIGWRLFFERLSKKALVKLCIKTILAAILLLGVYWILADRVHTPLGGLLPLPTVDWLWLLVFGLVALRGIWATILLKTARSPQFRGIRLFLIAMSLLLGLKVWFLQHAGGQIFLPEVMQRLSHLGFTTVSLPLMIVAVVTLMLLVAAGIDRSLFRDAAIGRRVRQSLGVKVNGAA